MADRDCKRIRDIVGLRVFLQVEESPNHKGHLLLVSIPISHHRLFDFGRRVFGPWDAQFGACEDDCPEGFGNIHRRRDIFGEQKSLGGDCIGTMLLDQFRDAIMNQPQSIGQRDLWGLHQAVIEAFELRSNAVDNAVTDAFESGVNSEDEQALARVPPLDATL